MLHISILGLEPSSSVVKETVRVYFDLLKFRVCRYIIYVKHGVYDESVIVDKKKANVTMIGDGSQKTVVTGNKSHAKKIRTFLTATFGTCII